MSARTRSLILGLGAAALLLAGAGALERTQRGRLERIREEELLYYPSGFAVRHAAMGYETAAADVAWLRGIQYYGEHRLTDQKYDLIGHVMEIVTTLDPAFTQPYVFGAFVMAQEMKQPERGLALLMRGLRANPTDWRLCFEVGFLHYVCFRDYASAARYFTWSSRVPGHEDYVERFAAFANARAGNTGMAVLLWKEVLATGNRYMQDVARRELGRLGAM
ncbi:MAG TPA: hypothetical protein VFD83_00295 [Candidatus Polarisedimenticolia bacterium]|nr:hypothetical protein [Candidatus Polarisedimenticolia bacterium]